MGLPAIYETARKYLFEDSDKMAKVGIPAGTIAHIVRIRDVYNFWVSHPSKPERAIVQELMSRGLERSQAYYDLGIIKKLLGELRKNTKEYIRYKMTEGLFRAIERAEASNNIDVAIRAWDKLAKYYQLDKPDENVPQVDVAPQVFKFTDDPTVAGYKPIPNIRDKIAEMKRKYWNEDVVDVEFEPIEFNEDDLFNPRKQSDAGEDLPQ